MHTIEKMYLEATSKTPNVSLDVSKGKFELKGRSIPENPEAFYAPIYDWINEYIDSPMPTTIIDVKLEYFNISSSKSILGIFKVFEKINELGTSSVEINWYFEKHDDDMAEAGKDFNAIIKLPFNLVEVTEII